MPRFFVDSEMINEDNIRIKGGDVNHIKNVLRMQIGEALTVCDGKGTDYECEIAALDRDEITLEIKDSALSSGELPQRLYLFQGLPKSDKMELIIQKAVELGVYEIIPVASMRSIVKIDAKKEDKKISRWQQIAEAAAKQSGRGIVPEIKNPMSFREALNYAMTMEGALIPYENAEGIAHSRGVVESMRDKRSVAIFIGPEGGFDKSEIDAATEAHVIPITLGKRILRTETAGLTILSLLMFQAEKEAE